ncbi:MAG: DUF4349 domain-containing protein [Anaerolineaceae bacterium]|jgi:hypothetical protein|nr:MAG: DUF4349 domain-containing protein [Anaerolineaceae bacterium]
MKRKRLFISLLLLVFSITSCSMARSSSETVSSEKMYSADQVAMEEAPAVAEEAVYASGAVPSYDVERIVIKNADLSLVVTDPVSALETISQMADEKGGFVVNSYVYKVTSSSGKELPAATITIRVPAEMLEDTLAEIKALVDDPNTDILSETVSGQDVTSEVTDLESRLRNLQHAEAQLLEIMDNATDTEDVMAVFQELITIREDIEVLQGQLKYYQESAKLSAIYINLQAKEAVAPITIGGWRPSLTLQRALQALVDGLKFLANAIIWIVIFVAPIALVIGLPIYFILKAAKKRRLKKKAEK